MVGNCKRSDFKRHQKYPLVLSSDQRSSIYGWLLGDGFIPKTKGRHFCFGFEQSSSKRDYVEQVFSLLDPYTKPKEIKTVLNDKTKWKKSIYETCRFMTVAHPVFTEIRKKWYIEDVKTIPTDLVLDWTMVAFWFADDGHSRKNGKELVFCSESFTKEENEFLITRFSRDLDIYCSLCKRNGGSNFGIRVLAKSYFDFVENIKPKLKDINCISYKLNVDQATRNTTPRYSDKEKSLAVKQFRAGDSLEEISNKIGCHKRTIKRWINAKAIV